MRAEMGRRCGRNALVPTALAYALVGRSAARIIAPWSTATRVHDHTRTTKAWPCLREWPARWRFSSSLARGDAQRTAAECGVRCDPAEGAGVRWLPRGLRTLLDAKGDRQEGVDETPQGILVEGAGRLLRLLRQMPNRRHRWICSDALNQEWRLNTDAIRFAIGGAILPADATLASEALSKIQLAAQHLLQSASTPQDLEALWSLFSKRDMNVVTPEDVSQYLWAGHAPEVNDFQLDHRLSAAAKLYAAHRLLDQNYHLFVRRDGRYHVRSIREREQAEAEKQLFDLRSKSLLLFLLRIDKQRRIRREQRLRKSASSSSSSTPSITANPVITTHDCTEALEQGPTHVTHLPPGLDLDVNVARSLFSPAELQEAEWWDPRGRDAVRIQFLERYALTPENEHSASPYIQNAVLKPLGYRGTAGDAFSCLVELGVIDEFANMHRLRAKHLGIHDYPQQGHISKDPFRPLPPMPKLDSIRKTHVSHHTVYTIDDASTTEVDDGISVDLNDPERWVFVHIADPTAGIPFEHGIEKQAREMVSTIYLPEITIPMMRPSVYRRFSLEPHRENHALTFGIKFNTSGGIDDFTIFPSTISKVKKLTYQQADFTLQANETELNSHDFQALHFLNTIAMQRKAWRLNHGAQSFHLPKPVIKVINTPHMKRVQVAAEGPMSPAQELVAEMMIAANHVAGLYAARNQLAVPFRYQADPRDLDPELLSVAHGLPEPLKSMEFVRQMQAAELALLPSRHSGLGLECYVQVTSPIRRYADMIAHRQIKAHLSGASPPYSADTLLRDLPHIQQRSREIKELVQQSNTFWVLQNFLRTSRKKIWEAVAVRVEEEAVERYPFFLVRVFFREIGWTRNIRLLRCPQPGEPLLLQVRHVSPHTDTIIFHELDRVVP